MPNDKQIYAARQVSIESCIEAHRQEAIACQKVISRLSRIQRSTENLQPYTQAQIVDLDKANTELAKAEAEANTSLISLVNDQLE